MCQVLSTDNIFKSTAHTGIVSSDGAVKKETGSLGEAGHSDRGQPQQGWHARQGEWGSERKWLALSRASEASL